MIQQLRVLDPSISAEVGTPERKIIDTVAEALTDAQLDLSLLSGAFDLDAKIGPDLDRFLALFGFARQRATFATGFVTFSRTTPSTQDIRVPFGTQLLAIDEDQYTRTQVYFRTTAEALLLAGQLSIVAPVQAVLGGTTGNVAANRITSFIDTPTLGITSVTNEFALTGGADEETDEAYKVRFKNTLFRNLAGTADQYYALAAALAFSTKANVVGPISRYQEYIQVPDVDDASSDPPYGTGNGSVGEYTTALSTIPYSKYTYQDVSYFVTNGRSGIDQVFYRQDVDFTMNADNADKFRGDAYRLYMEEQAVDPRGATYQPNITFANIYTGTNADIQAIRPGDVVMFEHSYMSSASRNDFSRNITNCVDVFVNGTNPVLASAVIARPGLGGSLTVFVDNASSISHFDNFRRVNEPEHRPIIGNILTPLFWQPVTDLPDEIPVGDHVYIKNVHYWAVEEISELGHTIRARNGIEWSNDVGGKAAQDPDDGPYTGPVISAHTENNVVVDDYTYDANIAQLQGALEGSKQVTTDVLGHRATMKYYKLDITVMYTPGVYIADVNLGIQGALQFFFDSLYFGTTIQLSDLLTTIHNVPGVDNVRWTTELDDDKVRVQEVDKAGNPLNVTILDRFQAGTVAKAEITNLYIAGEPTGGTFTLSLGGNTTDPLDYDIDATALKAAMNLPVVSGGLNANIATITGTGTPIDPWIITATDNGSAPLSTVSSFSGGPTELEEDFYLQDNELPSLPTGMITGDTLAGIIIRSRAQHTWVKA